MVKVPQYMSRPAMYVFFESDEIIVFIMPFMLWLFINLNFWLTLAISIAVTYLYRKEKSKSARGFLFHIYYMLGGKYQGFDGIYTRSYRE